MMRSARKFAQFASLCNIFLKVPFVNTVGLVIFGFYFCLWASYEGQNCNNLAVNLRIDSKGSNRYGERDCVTPCCGNAPWRSGMGCSTSSTHEHPSASETFHDEANGGSYARMGETM